MIRRSPDPIPAHITPSRTRRFLPSLFIIAFTCAALYRLVLLGQALYWGDLFLYFYPLQAFVQEQLRSGQIPLWNPYVFCGQPLVGNPQAWVFYPTTILLYVVPVWLYFTLNTVLHLALAGLGSYLYLRRLTADRTGATLGAIVFLGSGFMLARLQFPTMVQSAAYLPWILLLVDRIIERPRLWYGALLTVVVALELLAGHAQIAYMTLTGAIVYALIRLFQIRRHPARAWRALSEMAGTLSLGILTASVQLMPALQLYGESTREHLRWREANRFVLLPEQLSNFVLPNYYGNPVGGDYWGAGNAWEPCVFVGLIPILLAGYAVIRGTRRPAVRYFALLALISLLLSMGRFGGLYWAAYYIVPGVSVFHDPARFAFLTTFSIAALAAIGLRVMRDRGVTAHARSGIVVLAALNLLWFGVTLNPTTDPSALGTTPRALASIPMEADGRVYTSLRDDVWRRYVNYSEFGPEGPRYARELTDTLTPNVGLRYGVAEASGYEPVPLRAILEMDDLVQDAVIRQSPRLPELFGMMDAQALLLPHGTRYPHPDLQRLQVRGVSAYSLIWNAPRAWIVRKTLRVDGGQRSLAAIASPDFHPRSEAIVSDSPGLGESAVESDGKPDTPAVMRQSTGVSEISVDCGTERSFLVRSVAYYPGWRATVDGIPAQIERSDHAFQGVVLPQGKHTVRFSYQPFAFRLGLYATLFAGSLMVAGLTMGMIVRPLVRNRAPVKGIQERMAN